MAKLTGIEFTEDGLGFSIGGDGDGLNAQRSDWRKRLRQYGPNYFPGVVEGAQKAGLHPLFALSGSAPAIGSPYVSGPEGHFSGKMARKEEVDALQQSYIDLNNARRDEIIQRMAEESQKAKDTQNNGGVRQMPEGRMEPHPGEGSTGIFINPHGKKIEIPPGTPADALEVEFNDWAQWMPSNIARAWSFFKKDLAQLWLRDPEKAKSKAYDWLAKNRMFGAIPPSRLGRYLPDRHPPKVRYSRYRNYKYPSITADSP